MIWIRALAVWLAIIVVESVHGTLRQLFLAPVLGDFPARRIAVFTGALLIVAIATLTARWLGTRTMRERFQVGALWVVLTVAFEFLLGRLVLRYDWSRLLEDYDPSRGGLMLLGLAVMFLSPLIGARMRGLDR